ncbi:uncharacterized protein J3D65DRAFT_288273 [Phyllosticta citribraziliensis]|uniref:Uncharacterized protein n=1 Tax=Phyllosticta citribraziliensis TaxID=989973 RepID=A0ABR1LWV7_9PEZI
MRCAHPRSGLKNKSRPLWTLPLSKRVNFPPLPLLLLSLLQPSQPSSENRHSNRHFALQNGCLQDFLLDCLRLHGHGHDGPRCCCRNCHCHHDLFVFHLELDLPHSLPVELHHLHIELRGLVDRCGLLPPFPDCRRHQLQRPHLHEQARRQQVQDPARQRKDAAASVIIISCCRRHQEKGRSE